MEIILEEGELICSSCGGRGYHPSAQQWNTVASTCRKCGGDGKVDWVTNAMGTPKGQKTHGTSGYAVGNIATSTPQKTKVGALYHNTKTNKLQVYDGMIWREVI